MPSFLPAIYAITAGLIACALMLAGGVEQALQHPTASSAVLGTVALLVLPGVCLSAIDVLDTYYSIMPKQLRLLYTSSAHASFLVVIMGIQYKQAQGASCGDRPLDAYAQKRSAPAYSLL